MRMCSGKHGPHDKDETGSDAGGRCSECRRERQRVAQSRAAYFREYNKNPARRAYMNQWEQRKYWTNHEYRFNERRKSRERQAPHIWTVSKEAV